MAAVPDESEDTTEESSPMSKPSAISQRNSQTAKQSALTYEDGLRHAHDYLKGVSQTNPFAGREGFGDLSSGNKPVAPIPAPNPQTIGTAPERIPDTSMPGQTTSLLNPARNVVKETMAAPGSATNQTNFPAGLPRTPTETPEVGGTRAITTPPTPAMRSRIQTASNRSKPAFFGGG